MKNKLSLFLVSVLISSFLIGVVLAVPMPSAFYGEVIFDGNPIPDGYKITAKINGLENTKCLVIEGKYGHGSNACIVTHNVPEIKIDFYIEELKIGDAIFLDKEITRLDFELEYLPELPEPEVPDNGGSGNETPSNGGGEGTGSGTTSGTSSGGGGGSSSSSTSISSSSSCVENWFCENWGVCSGGIQKRKCVELNDCGTSVMKPSEVRECVEEGQSPITRTEKNKTGFFAGITGAVIGLMEGGSGIGFLFIFIIAIVALFLIFSKKNKTPGKEEIAKTMAVNGVSRKKTSPRKRTAMQMKK